MDRVHTLDTRRPKPATGDEVDADRFAAARSWLQNPRSRDPRTTRLAALIGRP
jgi:hypothetical protein